MAEEFSVRARGAKETYVAPHLSGSPHQLGGIGPPRSTRWSRKANWRSLRSAAARSSRRTDSMIS